MAGTRKTPKLRVKDGCFVANIYKPDGKRSTISFGPVGDRTEGDIYAAFGKWLNLFSQHPHKVLSFKSPYEAIAHMINPQDIVKVGELLDKYTEVIGQHASDRPCGRPHPDLERLKRLGKFLEPYRQWPVSGFGADELYAVQKAMVKYRYDRGDGNLKPYTRSGINKVISYIYRIWQWGIGREITTEAQKQLLKEVRPLRTGQTTAKDNPKRALVTKAEFKEVTKHATTVVADMLELIWLTAMRPGEVCRMRPFDIHRDEPECWLYVPGRGESLVGEHKTAYLQRVRAIPLTSKAQNIIKPRVEDFQSLDFVFSPAEAMQEIRDQKSANRKTPMSCGNRPGTNRKQHPMITPGKKYLPNSLYNAVIRACERSKTREFTPYDLRRSAATRIRSELGKEAAKLLLGHVSTDTTDIYLLDEVKESMKVAKQLDAAREAEEEAETQVEES